MGDRVTQTPHEPDTGELSQFQNPQGSEEPGVGSPAPPAMAGVGGAAAPDLPAAPAAPAAEPTEVPAAGPHPAVISAGNHDKGTRLPASLVPARWWTGAVAGAGAYVATLVVALLLTLLAVVGLAATGSTDSIDVPSNPLVSNSDLPSPWSILFQFAAQLPALGMLGSLSGAVSIDAGMFGSVQATIGITMVPLALTAISVVALFWGSRLAERLAPSSGRLQRWAQAVVGGIAFSLLLNVIATAASIKITASEHAAINLNAANFASIFVAFIVALLVGVAARTERRDQKTVSGRVAYLRSLLRDAVLAATVHLGAFVVIAVPVVVAVVGVKAGWAAFLSFPLWAPTAGLLLFGMGHLAAFGRSAEGSLGGGLGSSSQSAYGYAVAGLDDFGIPAWAGGLLVVLALLAMCAAATCWYLRRGSQSPSNALSWVYLPVVFLITGTFVTWLGSVSASGHAGSLASGSAGIGLAWWTPFLMLAWGGATDAASRFLAPKLAPVLPAALVAFVQKYPSALHDTGFQVQAGTPAANLSQARAQAQGHGEAPVATPVDPARAATALPRDPGNPEPPAPVVVPRPPMSKKAKRSLALVGGAIALVAVLAIGATVAVNVVRGSHGPDKAVSGFLDAVVAGDAARAMEIGDPSIPNDQRGLLSNAIYAKAAKRVDSYSIVSTTVDGDGATVRAELRQNGTKVPLTFSLVKKNPGFLDPHWGLQNVPMGSVAVAVPGQADSVTVNGVDVKVGNSGTSDSGVLRLPAFPGSYTVGLPASSKYLSADPVTVDARLGEQAPSMPATLETRPNEAFGKEVQAQVNSMLTTCEKSTDIRPEGCPFSRYTSGKVRNVVWKVATRPTVTAASYGEGTWYLSTDKAGAATVSFERDSSYGFGTPKWEKDSESDISIRVSGKVALDGETLTVSFAN